MRMRREKKKKKKKEESKLEREDEKKNNEEVLTPTRPGVVDEGIGNNLDDAIGCSYRYYIDIGRIKILI